MIPEFKQREVRRYWRTSQNQMPMLSEVGAYPPRQADAYNYWEWIGRSDMPASPWLADWENSMARAGWTVIRKLPYEATEQLPWDNMEHAHPEDADLYCHWRKIYLALLPSTLAGVEVDDEIFTFIRDGYPGSTVIIHASNSEPNHAEEGKKLTARDLLSGDNTLRCIEFGGLVEFHGVLYEPDGTPDQDGHSNWKATTNPLAKEIYQEYLKHSLYYQGIDERNLLDEKIATSGRRRITVSTLPAPIRPKRNPIKQNEQ